MKDLSLDKQEQGLLDVFGNLSEDEMIEVFEDSIRDEQDEPVRQVLQAIYSDFKDTLDMKHH